MSDSQASDQAKTISNRKAVTVVALLFTIFLAPYSYIMYLYKTGDTGQGGTENGVFFEKPVDINNLTFYDFEQQTWSIAEFKNQWLILNFVDGNCANECLDRLFNTQQVLKTLVRYKGSTEQAVAIIDEHEISTDLQTVLNLKKELHVISNGEVLADKLDSLQQESLQNYLMIVDPDGRILMYYSPEKRVTDMLRDLKRLLKVSNIGYRSEENAGDGFTK